MEEKKERDNYYNLEEEMLANDVSCLSINDKYSYDKVIATVVSEADKYHTNLCVQHYKKNKCHEKYSGISNLKFPYLLD
eukprot:1003751-Ditylum_brightwellii.AAC.1